MWPFAMVLASILTAFAVASYLLEVRVRDQALAERVAAVRASLQQKIAKDADLMQASLSTLMANNAVRQSLLQQDRPALLREVSGLFEALRDQHRVTHLYFNNADMVNVVRAQRAQFQSMHHARAGAWTGTGPAGHVDVAFGDAVAGGRTGDRLSGNG